MISDPTLRKATAVQQDERSDTRDSQSRSALALSMLDRVGCGYIFLKDRRTIVEANATARLILGREARSVHDLDQLTCAFKRLLARAPNRPALGPLAWIVIWNQYDSPFVLNQSTGDVPDGTSVVMLLDLDAHLEPSPFMLRRMFGLTMAETRLALKMARGEVPLDVARSSHLSRSTVRSQLSALFAKTQTKRQAELVTLLTRIAVLP